MVFCLKKKSIHLFIYLFFWGVVLIRAFKKYLFSVPHCTVARSMKECERFEMFTCDGICMIKSALCDGMADCKDGVDERGCSNGWIIGCINI